MGRRSHGLRRTCGSPRPWTGIGPGATALLSCHDSHAARSQARRLASVGDRDRRPWISPGGGQPAARGLREAVAGTGDLPDRRSRPYGAGRTVARHAPSTPAWSQGRPLVVIAPYFLWPGDHWDRDIPALAAEAARRHPGVRYLVAAPLGPHPLLADIVEDRVDRCLAHARGGTHPGASSVRGPDGCRHAGEATLGADR